MARLGQPIKMGSKSYPVGISREINFRLKAQTHSKWVLNLTQSVFNQCRDAKFRVSTQPEFEFRAKKL